MAHLIIDVPKKDPQGRPIFNNANEHLSNRGAALQDLGVIHRAEFKEHLGRYGVQDTGYAEYLTSTYHLVEVEDDDVFGAMARILRFHSDPGSTTFPHGYVERVEVDHPLALASPNPGIGTNFKLCGMHATYTGPGYMDVPAAHAVTKGEDIKIAVVDSGVLPGTVSFSSFHDVITRPASPGGEDLGGHGTAIATIIKDVAPRAELHVVRAVETDTATLWNTMAGVAAAVYDCKAHIINLSLGFQHLSKTCRICGGTGHARSKVFETLLRELAELYRRDLSVPSPIYVTATGNNGASGVNYPAEFPMTLAVGSVNSKFERSGFSNYGTSKAEYVMLPGGEEASGAPSEWVGEGQDDKGKTTYCLGTSRAAAYASGLLALYWADRFKSKDADEFTAAVLGQCDTGKIPSHSASEHGAGFLYYH